MRVHEFGACEDEASRPGPATIPLAMSNWQGGGSENNSDHNNVEPKMTFRATFTDPPVFKPYARWPTRPASTNRKRSGTESNTPPKGYGVMPVSSSTTIRSGLAISRSPTWRNYDDPSLFDHVLGLDGLLTWCPTELTSIVFAFGTSISDNFTDGSTSNRNWTADLTQAMRDNVDLLRRSRCLYRRGWLRRDL